jgi:hypothetical protein
VCERSTSHFTTNYVRSTGRRFPGHQTLLNKSKSVKGGEERNGLIGELEKRWTQVVGVKCEPYGNLHGPYLSLLTILAQILVPLRSGSFDTAPGDAGDVQATTLARLWLGVNLGGLFRRARLRQEVVGRCLQESHKTRQESGSHSSRKWFGITVMCE